MSNPVLSIEKGELKVMRDSNAVVPTTIDPVVIEAAKIRAAEGCPGAGNLLLVVCVFALIFKTFFIDRKKNKERDEELLDLRARSRGMSESMYNQRVEFERLQEKVKDNHIIAAQLLEVHKVCDHQPEQQQCNCKKHKKNK